MALKQDSAGKFRIGIEAVAYSQFLINGNLKEVYCEFPDSDYPADVLMSNDIFINAVEGNQYVAHCPNIEGNKLIFFLPAETVIKFLTLFPGLKVPYFSGS